MLENAVRICDAKFGNIYRWDGDALHLLATQNTPLLWWKPAGVYLVIQMQRRPQAGWWLPKRSDRPQWRFPC